jgi:hypothetical protein
MGGNRPVIGGKVRAYLIVVITLAVVGCVVFALSFYLKADALLRSGALSTSTDEQQAIADAMGDFSVGVIVLAVALAFIGGVVIIGTSSERSLAEKGTLVGAMVVIVGSYAINFAPSGGFLDTWRWGLLAAINLLFLGAALALKPVGDPWVKNERIWLAVLGGFILILLLVQVLVLT